MESMRSFLPLPNELFHCIIEYIVYTPQLDDEATDLGFRPLTKTLFKHASPELLALSVASTQLHQICLPFLLANIQIGNVSDVRRLERDLALCAKFTKTLVINGFCIFGRNQEMIISQIVPQLQQLSIVQLPTCWDESKYDLPKIILAHPTVTLVVVHGIPQARTGIYDVSQLSDMGTHDLSKVVVSRIDSIRAFLPGVKTYFDRGMRLRRLKLEPNFIRSLQSHTLPGLKEIELYMYTEYSSLSWLSLVSSTQPTLNKLWLLGMIDQDTFPFLSPLVEESQRQNLQHSFAIRRVGLRRDTFNGRSSQDWRVMGLAFSITSASKVIIEFLDLVASLYPKLEALTINLDRHSQTYDIDDLASVFARFSSLRIIYFKNVYERLYFRPENESFIHPVPQEGSTDLFIEPLARAESRLILFTSRVAKQARNLDLVHIDDSGTKFVVPGYVGHWFLQGWLRVLNGDRDVVGTLGTYYY
ncbi:hypothetical protein EV361DRAFT_919202 [Lentinula raphanica]|nr:hypothetical protein EV361DRAFT_919202 [Lentinula raphanica]